MVLDVLAPSWVDLASASAAPRPPCQRRIGANQVEYLEIVHLRGRRATP